MILSDRSIAHHLADGDLVIDPLERNHIQPSSVDLRLGTSFRVFDGYDRTSIDPFGDNSKLTREIVVAGGEVFILHPGEFVLATTLECVGLPSNIVGRVDGKSSLGRLGLLIHATAGFIDPGFHGQITLELSNVARLPIELRVRMKIAQISFMLMDSPADRPYGHPGLGSKYNDQKGATASRYEANGPVS